MVNGCGRWPRESRGHRQTLRLYGDIWLADSHLSASTTLPNFQHFFPYASTFSSSRPEELSRTSHNFRSTQTSNQSVHYLRYLTSAISCSATFFVLIYRISQRFHIRRRFFLAPFLMLPARWPWYFGTLPSTSSTASHPCPCPPIRISFLRRWSAAWSLALTGQIGHKPIPPQISWDFYPFSPKDFPYSSLVLSTSFSRRNISGLLSPLHCLLNR